MPAPRVKHLALLAPLWIAAVGPVNAADLVARPGAEIGDPIHPTVPHGFAADLPRSPLVDAFVNAGQRFPSAVEAQRHCPGDDVVQVEPFSATYRIPTPGGEGAFMCKAAALQEGDLPR